MKLPPKRYEIYFADLNPTLGSEISKVRPVVVISQIDILSALKRLRFLRLTT